MQHAGKISIQPTINVKVMPAMYGRAMAKNPAIMMSTLSAIDQVDARCMSAVSELSMTFLCLRSSAARQTPKRVG
jgi:hypothetical protein